MSFRPSTWAALLLAATFVCPSAQTVVLGQVQLGVVQVDASPLGADFVTADVFINVTEESDWWTVGGIAGGPVAPGLAHYFHLDELSHPYRTAPGNQTPQAAFATFVSLPRDQFANKRFGPNGAASIIGSYDPPSTVPDWTDQAINIAFIEFPPSPDGVGVPDFGFIARVTLENNATLSGFATSDIVVSASPAAGVLLAEYRVVSASREHPVPLSEMTFGFYGVPEPSSLLLLGVASLVALSSRRTRPTEPRP